LKGEDYFCDFKFKNFFFLQTITLYVIPFWNLWDHWSTMGQFLDFLRHQDEQEGQEHPNTRGLNNFGYFNGSFDIAI